MEERKAAGQVEALGATLPRWPRGELVFAHFSPEHRLRAIVATTDPATLPDLSTWYAATNLPRPGTRRARESLHEAADLAEVVRLYGLRSWVEQSYKQVKHELGWADFAVRSAAGIRRRHSPALAPRLLRLLLLLEGLSASAGGGVQG